MGIYRNSRANIREIFMFSWFLEQDCVGLSNAWHRDATTTLVRLRRQWKNREGEGAKYRSAKRLWGVEVVRRRKRGRGKHGASTRHEGRGLIHRGRRTQLHAVVERISFIAILDERDEPVTRLPRESQGREPTEFPLSHSRDTRDNRESSLLVRHMFDVIFRRMVLVRFHKERGDTASGSLTSWHYLFLKEESFAKT